MPRVVFDALGSSVLPFVAVLIHPFVTMNFPEKEIVSGPRSFVTEKDIEERRRQKQEEWERTRKPDDPLGVYFLR